MIFFGLNVVLYENAVKCQVTILVMKKPTMCEKKFASRPGIELEFCASSPNQVPLKRYTKTDL